jgi:hypothetical protein
VTFPTIPSGAQALVVTQADTSATRTFPSLSSLTKSPGDLLVAVIVVYTGSGFSGWGGGFTEVADIGISGGFQMGIATKVSTGSETGTFTVTQAGVTGHATMFLMAIPGAHATTAPETVGLIGGTNLFSSSATLTPSWGADDTLWLAVGSVGETSTTGSFTGLGSTPPTSFSGLVDSGISADVVGGLETGIAFQQVNASSLSSGAWSGDTSNAKNMAGLIAIRPAPSVTTQNGAANLTATSSLTIGAQQTQFAAVPLTTTASLTSGATVIRPSAVSLSSASTLTTAGTVTGSSSSVSMTATSLLTVGAFLQRLAAASLTTTSTATIAGTVTAGGTGAISFVNAQGVETEQTATTNLTATGTLPTGHSTNDLLLMSVSSNRGTQETMVSDPTSQGWTLAETVADGAETTRYYWKLDSGSESAPVSVFTNALGTLHSVITVIGAWRGVNQTTPILAEAQAVETSSSTTTHTGATLTNTDAASWGVFFASARQVIAPNSWTPGSGLTERVDIDAGISSSNDHWATLDDTNGTVPTGSWTPSATTSAATAVVTMWSVLIKVGTGGGGPTTQNATASLTTTSTLTAVGTTPPAAAAISLSTVSRLLFVGAGPPNLIQNSSFETDLSGWNPTNANVTVTRVAGGFDGNWTAQINPQGAGVFAPIECDERTPVVPGQFLVASAWFRWAASATPGVIKDIKVEVRFFDSSDTLISSQAGISVTPPSDGSWIRRINNNNTVPVGASYVVTRCTMASGDTGDAAQFDAVYVVCDTQDYDETGTGSLALLPRYAPSPATAVVRTAVATAALTTSSTLTASPGASIINGIAALTAASTLTVAAVRVVQGAVSLIATSTLTVAGVRTQFAAVALTTTSTLTSSALRTVNATANLTAASTLTAAAIRSVQGAISLTATASLTVAGFVQSFAAASFTTTSTLTAIGTRVLSGTASFSTTSTLTTAGSVTRPATASFVASSTLTAVGTRGQFASAAFTSSSTLTTTGSVLGSTSAQFTTTSTLTTAAVRQTFGAAALTTTSTLSVVGTRDQVSAAALTAASTLTAGAFRQQFATAALVATSSLTTAGIRVQPAAVSLSTVSTLSATGATTTGVSSFMTTVSTLTVAGLRQAVVAAALTSTSTLSVAAVRAVLGGVSLTATASLTISAVREQQAAVSLSTTATLAVSAVVTVQGAVGLTITATLVIVGSLSGSVAAHLVTTATLTVAVTSQQFTAVALVTTSTLTSVGTLIPLATNYQALLTATSYETVQLLGEWTGSGYRDVSVPGVWNGSGYDLVTAVF